tara:strand:+ start:2186 stop:5341 length:3156 start_codon:yes stop_codon:yes gene_type:complete
MKFAHIADTHIRNLKYHSEYREVFSKLYEDLRERQVDYIIHCGDIAHTKTQISPEFVEMCSDFLRNLADIAPTYIILGNHDGNLRNSNRQDALTPIVSALNHPDLFLLKNSGEVDLDETFTINVLSVFDRDNWIVPSNPDRVNIALYHGSISGVTTDTGWKMENGEDDINIFNSFDYGFLGDIHKTNQTLDKAGKVRYPGSTVQQNHGETNDKGFLLWDILDHDNFVCEHVVIENPKPFITIKLTPKGRIPSKTKIVPGARVRLVSENNLPLDSVRKVVDAVKARFQPETVTYLNRSAGEYRSMEGLTDSLKKDDLRDPIVQESLIKEYLEDFQPSEKTLKQVYEMNKKYNALVEKDEEVFRNINWKLKKLEWDNLFNYGEGNCINFENFDGVVGILGKNFSGKSSIIDSLLYTIYNTTSKNERKNLNLINQNKDECRGYVEIDVGTKTYTIERTSDKYTKKLKGRATLEAKTDVEFNIIDTVTGETESLNGTSRMETDKNIRKIFGTVEDFLMTSMASQLDSLAYINEGSMRRKEILAKFLDLEFFDRKFKMIKEDSSHLAGALKRLSGRDYPEEISESRTELARAEAELSVNERQLESLDSQHLAALAQVTNLQEQIDSAPKEFIDIKNVNKRLDSNHQAITALSLANENKRDELESEKQFLEKIENFVSNFDIDLFNKKKEVLDEHMATLEKIDLEISQYETKKEQIDNKIERLKRVPCSYSDRDKCLFVKDARRSLEDVANVKINMNQLTLSKSTLGRKIEELNPTQVEEYINKYELILEKKMHHKNVVSSLELKIEKNKTKLMQLQKQSDELSTKQDIYEQNKEAIEDFESLLLRKQEMDSELESLILEKETARKKVLELYKNTGSLEQKHNEIIEQEQSFCDLENEYTISDLYMRCMHPNGVSYDVIKKRLPLINDEISKILTNIVDFEVFFESDEKKLDILLKHPKHDPRPIEMGSGAEKTIAAMAIRLALLNVSTLPKSDIFILDEPGTSLDAENMDGFIHILDMIKSQFRTVILISHLDSLKDTVDSQILIEKQKGVASVNE